MIAIIFCAALPETKAQGLRRKLACEKWRQKCFTKCTLVSGDRSTLCMDHDMWWLLLHFYKKADFFPWQALLPIDYNTIRMTVWRYCRTINRVKAHNQFFYFILPIVIVIEIVISFCQLQLRWSRSSEDWGRQVSWIPFGIWFIATSRHCSREVNPFKPWIKTSSFPLMYLSFTLQISCCASLRASGLAILHALSILPYVIKTDFLTKVEEKVSYLIRMLFQFRFIS